MADRLIFPIGFDFVKGAEAAAKDARGVLDRLQGILNSKPLQASIHIDKSGLDSFKSGFGESINIIRKEMQDLEKRWNDMINSTKFNTTGGGIEISGEAKEIISQYLQLTEALRTYGKTLQDVAREHKKAVDDEIKAQEKALAATQRRYQQDADLARKREEVESRVAAKIKEAQSAANDKQNLSVVEQKTNAYNRQAEVVSKLQAKIEQIKRIESSGYPRLTLDDGTNSELKNRLIQRSIELTKELGSETVKLAKAEADMFNAQKKDAEQFSKATMDIVNNLAEVMIKLREVKGIGIGFEGAKSTTAVNNRLQEFYDLSRKLDEIDAKYARLQATGAAESKIGEYTARANALLDERVRITERLVAITKTAEEAQRDRAAKAKQSQTVSELNKALLAQEDIMGNLTAKLRIYQQQIQAQVVGSDAWNKTALEIRRITDELQRANQQMMDFQQKAFQGLSRSLTEAKVRELTQYREQLRQIEQDFNRLNQSGGTYGTDGKLTVDANNILKKRQQIIAEINKMLTTAADAQLKREKEINAVIKQRQAEESKVKAARQAELAALKQKRAENDRIRKILAAEENTIKSITAKLQVQQQRLQSTSMDSDKFKRIAKEVERLSKALDEAQRKMNGLSGKAVAPEGVKEVTEHFQKQSSYVERLIKRMAVYTSFAAVGGFLTKVREVTAQFELQRVSLGAIIQDQTRANQLFSEIKQFALKSPITIMDLTKYTKQVAAYRIETDKLFDTTKRLADVSVGLGVDMQRIVLAYGQVKAASYLRAAEIRQFTEAGIPLLELLAEKFSQLNGEAVTTEKVMDMVSKRMVGFEMVEQIFNDMTSAGGMFFNMQEKQGNTLYGMWAKLGDAAAIMYNEIGNTKYVNEGMKNAIEALTSLMRNWDSWLKAIIATGVPTATLLLTFKSYVMWLNYIELATKKNTAANIAARMELIKKSIVLRTFNALLLKCHVSLNRATAFTIAFRTALAAIGNIGFMALITGITLLVEKIFQARSEANKLKEALDDIDRESAIEQMKSARNFESLANVAVKAADGSKKQKDALDELHRTYKDIIPLELMTIENLRLMNGNYIALTESIKDYVAERMKQKKIDTIIEATGSKMLNAERKIKDLMKDTWNYEEMERYMSAYESVIRKNPEKKAAEAMKEAAEISGIEWTKMLELSATTRDKLAAALRAYAKPLKEQVEQIDAVEAAWERGYESLDKYGTGYKKLVEKVQDTPITNVGGVKVSNNDYLAQQQRKNLEIYEAIVPTLKRILSDAGFAWQEGWGYLIKEVDTSAPELISTINFDLIEKVLNERITRLSASQMQAIRGLKKLYNDLGPTDKQTRIIRQRFTEIVQSITGGIDSMSQYSKYLMTNGQNMEAYVKFLKEQREALTKQLEALTKTGNIAAKFSLAIKNIFAAITGGQVVTAEELKKQIEAITKMLSEIGDFDKTKPTRQSDPRLQEAQNIVSEIEKLYNKSIELEKFMSRSTALDKMAEQYKGALAEMDKWAKKVGVDLTGGLIDEKGFLNVLRNIKAYIAKLPKSERAVLDLEAKIGDAQFNRLQKDLEEKTKQLAEKVSKTKTAREFFDKILEQTGDIDIATHLSLSIYGDTGEGLFEDVVAQIKDAFKSENVEVAVAVDAAIDTTNKVIDYQKLSKAYEKYQNDLLESNRKTAQDIISNGQKAAATQVQTWEKELAKAKDFEQKRADVISTESQRRIAIIKATTNENAAEMARLLALSYDKQAQDLAKLSVDEFKGGEDYIKVFQDLDAVSGATLDRMQKRLEEMIETVKGTENVEGLKTLIESLEKIKDEKISRNPLQGMIESFKQYRQARKDLNEAKIAEAEALSAYNEERVVIEQDIAQAKAEQEVAQQRVNSLENQGKAGTVEYKQAQLDVVAAEEKVVAATKRQEQAQNKVRKAQKKTTDAADAAKGASKGFQKSVQAAADGLDAAADAMRQIADLLGIAEDTELGAIVDGLISGFQQTVALLTAMLALTTAIEAECWPILAVAAAAGVLMAVFSVISNNKVRKANKEIEAQQELIDRLQYAYDRLEKAAEGAFGGEYINNYTERLKALEKQEKAYLKQAEAEESKGKKADEDKIQDYKDAARDAADEIKDLKSQIAEQFLGTDIYSAARDFAAAWLDAYKSFSNTADAMREKFEDLMQNLIIETALGKVMETALAPFFKQIQNASTSDMMSSKFWEQNAALMEQGISAANRGASTLMGYFEQFGLISRDAEEGLTGISRDIASASEESINGLAAGINTQNFYISQIHADVQGIYNLLMQRQNGLAAPQVAEGISLTDLVTLQNQHLAQLPNIAQNTADTVARLDEMLSTIKGVIVPRGTRGGRVVNTQN